ncbi:tRNA uridine(34) 5-carboxymethylaminomethyl modification radical SAM/GNAT enzyme Elp3 [Collinsella sp. zg1085]|uniref:elongator complex protein 3 n=1 Tax=Collinsella sp. zg1085 TaxID=2844380 RepID=UPI001C0E0579|nr:tRNA uridine(34) 5-carboxymethylaminomethyl modification radical SAM/GNAT enzyme Elp3 [Collinsella sp. zg1085]QWT17243.1 tRNA uridine(34) 5-carboxymethylaminomethyl modification radical SAM/GNAT enzyme Elp3 [Collinsella sp. zg1085]
MEDLICRIVDCLRQGQHLDDRALVKLMHEQLRRDGVPKQSYAKRRLLPFYQKVKAEDPKRWQRWNIDPELERALIALLRMKPRRSASGVATITVITKPWPCSGSCIFCPNDLRMPKSYLHKEPACERAEQHYFDPYLQVAARLTALKQMGHPTDKIELIVLGGTWSDYPEPYRIWFIAELFRALNDDASLQERDVVVVQRRTWYEEHGFPQTEDERVSAVAGLQSQINQGAMSYNTAVERLYGRHAGWIAAADMQQADMDSLYELQKTNEQAIHRVVGLVIETRPDTVTPEALTSIRALGCTKVQMGIQSLDQHILDINHRGMGVKRIAHAFAWLRLFGFKLHVHYMVNLMGATPEIDCAQYRMLVSNPAYCPDEVKLYPCALIESAELNHYYETGAWQAYDEDDLLRVLQDNVLETPPYCRISRMIRDFSSDDIVAGNKKPNLRQMVERRLSQGSEHTSVQEIRFREVGTAEVDAQSLSLHEFCYDTSVSTEYFLQWLDATGHIAGFLRLSLPKQELVAAHIDVLPIALGEAMIREVHIYGATARLGEAGQAAQHTGLGKALIQRALEIADEAGYERMNVISAVGTRGYYERLGFHMHGLYQQRLCRRDTCDEI